MIMSNIIFDEIRSNLKFWLFNIVNNSKKKGLISNLIRKFKVSILTLIID